MKSVLSIFLSITILFGSIGFTIATHYCYGKAVETRFLLDLGSFGCGMSGIDGDCEQKDENGLNLGQRSCCDNTFESAELDSDYKPQTVSQNFKVKFLTALILTSVHLLEVTGEDKIRPSYHSPPPADTDRRILFQSFLI